MASYDIKANIESEGSVGISGDTATLLYRSNELLIGSADSSHHHRLKLQEWDREKFGPDVTDFVSGHGFLDPTIATFKDAYACGCGLRVIVNHRGPA